MPASIMSGMIGRQLPSLWWKTYAPSSRARPIIRFMPGRRNSRMCAGENIRPVWPPMSSATALSITSPGSCS